MKRYQWLLFDLDGTLIHSHEGIYSCIRHALKSMGETVFPTDDELRKTIGPPLEYTFSHFFGMSEERAVLATQKYREKYKETGVYENTLIGGVKEALTALKKAGYMLAVATSKPAPFALKIAEQHGIKEYFQEIVGCGLDGSLPTKAAVIEEAIKRLGAKKEKTLMIGDRKHDIEGANANGVSVAIVNVGYAERDEFNAVKPDYLFQDFKALTEALL